MVLNKSKYLNNKPNSTKKDFFGNINVDINVTSTINPLTLSYKGKTTDGDPIEVLVYGDIQGDIIRGFGFAELELNVNNLSPTYCMSRFFILGSATENKISFVGSGDLRNNYQLIGKFEFNSIVVADNDIIRRNESVINGFLSFENPIDTIAPVTLKRLPDALYNKNVTETNVGRILRAYDKELLRIKTRIKMIESDQIIEFARHSALINNSGVFYQNIDQRIYDIEFYRSLLQKCSDILLLEDTEDMFREGIRFFTGAEPTFIDLTNKKMQLGKTRLGKNCYAIDRDIRTFTTKIIINNPEKKIFNRKGLMGFLKIFKPVHINLILQFEDGEIVKI